MRSTNPLYRGTLHGATLQEIEGILKECQLQIVLFESSEKISWVNMCNIEKATPCKLLETRAKFDIKVSCVDFI